MSFAAAACAAVLLACGPGQVSLAKGTLLGYRPIVDGPLRVIDLHDGRTRWRLPPGVLGGHLLLHRDGALITWFDADTGARVGDAVLQAHGAFALVGASQDGRTAVLARTETRSTTFALLSRSRERDVWKAGHWRFEALNGGRLTLTPAARALPGTPITEADSQDGRYRFTLFHGGGGDHVWVLDTTSGRSRAVALPGSGYALVPDSQPAQLWAVSPHGSVVLLDVTTGAVVSSFRFDPGVSVFGNAIASLAPDGEHIALTDADHLWVITPVTRAVVREKPHVAIALGWSPDERTLWVVGERSRVSPLRPGVVHH